MKTTIAIFIFAFSLTTFAQDEGEIIKETWTCKNDNISFVAIMTANKLTSTIDAYGSGKTAMTYAREFTGLVDGGKTKLTGGVLEHDTWDFDATLVRTGEDFEYSPKKRTETKGQLVLITDQFIDCVGNRSGADLIECKVVIERK